MDTIDHDRQQGQARRLAEALLEQPDDAACIACLDTLEEFVAAQLAGEDHVARWPEVARHLDACVACAESYALIYTARLTTPPAPANVPAPNLGFLQSSAAEPRAPAALRAAVARAGSRLRLTLSRSLLDLLPPPAGPALAFRSGEATPLFELALDEPGGAIERLAVSAYHGEAAERCVVRVQLALRGREWPDLAGVPVVLSAGDERRTAATDAWGETVFEDLPVSALPGLVVEVDGGV